MSIKLTNLSVEIKNRKILNNISLEILDGDTVLILGPNGHGKSTILKSIMRHYDTNITDGNIEINNFAINNYTTDKIVNDFNIYFSVQNPVEIPGLSMIELLRNEASIKCGNVNIIELFKIVNKKMDELQLNKSLLDRSINSNFSGGEKKKSEIIQMQIMDPNYIILDEIDSGLDVDAIDVIANALIEEKKKNKTIVYISHNDRLLKKIPPNKVVLIFNGTIAEIGDVSLAEKINKIGYKRYATEKGIKLMSNDDDFLKDIQGYHCNGK